MLGEGHISHAALFDLDQIVIGGERAVEDRLAGRKPECLFETGAELPRST